MSKSSTAKPEDLPPIGMDLVVEARRNWEERGLANLDAMVAATSLARAHQIVLGRINGALNDFGLTFSRYEALALLSFTRSGSMAMARMGERLQVHPTSVTSTIDRLERDGHVERTPHPDDRRATLATLTSQGRRILGQATRALEAICLLYTSPSPRDRTRSRMPSSA